VGSRGGLAASPVLCALRLGAPPCHVGSDARSDPNRPARASAASREAAPACDWHRSIETGARPALVVSGRRSSACSLRSSPRVGAVMRLRVSRCVPCGSPRRRLPVKAPGDADTSITLRLASAWSGWWTPAPRYRCLRIEAMSPAALVQSTVFNEHPRVARFPICSRRASLCSRLGSCGPAALRGQVPRRLRETPPCRGFGATDSDGGAVGPRRRPRSGSSRAPNGPSFGYGDHACGHTMVAARVAYFAEPVPRVLATDAPAHHPLQSFGVLRVIRLLVSQRTTLRSSESGAPFTAGSRCSEEQRAATTGLARGHRSLPTCFSRAALRARYASASRPDVPHAAHRLLSIERARSTPRTTANPDGDTGQCCRQAMDLDRSAGSRPSRGGAPGWAQHPRLGDRSPGRIYPQWVVVRTPHVARQCPEPLEERPGRRCGAALAKESAS